jgi:hypothetical protein
MNIKNPSGSNKPIHSNTIISYGSTVTFAPPLMPQRYKESDLMHYRSCASPNNQLTRWINNLSQLCCFATIMFKKEGKNVIN